MPNYKPEGYKAVTPYLIVKNAESVLKFIEQVFDGKLLEKHVDDNGKIIHAAMIIDDSIIELSESNEVWHTIPAALHVYVPDVDTVFKKALAAGAKSLGEPSDKHYGERGAELADQSGNNWYIATYKGTTTGESAPND